VAVYLNRDATFVAIRRSDLNTEHHPVPNLFSRVPR
jgi:hypothetical protein